MSWRDRVDAIIRDTQDALYGASKSSSGSSSGAVPRAWGPDTAPKPRAALAPMSSAQHAKENIAFEVGIRMDTLRKDIVALQQALQPLVERRRLVEGSVAATKDAVALVAEQVKALGHLDHDIKFDLQGTTDALKDAQTRGGRLQTLVNELEVDLRDAISRIKAVEDRAATAVTADQVARLASDSLRSLRNAAIDAAEGEAKRQAKEVEGVMQHQLQELNEQLVRRSDNGNGGIGLMTPSFCPFSFLRSFVPSFLRSFVPSFLRSFVPSFLRSFLRSFVPSFLPSFVRSFLLCVVAVLLVAAFAKPGAPAACWPPPGRH